MRCPVNYISVTQKYTYRHGGCDLGWYGNVCGYNQPIYACDDGKVIYNRKQLTGGYVIAIAHDNGLVSYYGHLLKDSQRVHEGDKVKKGQQIANMGKSGIVTGYHLHFALSKGSKVTWNKKNYLDPLAYINMYDNQVIKDKDKNLIKHTKHCTAEDGLNIRTTTNTKGKVVKTAQYNEEVETYGTKNGWNIVDNVRGYYCSSKFLK